MTSKSRKISDSQSAHTLGKRPLGFHAGASSWLLRKAWLRSFIFENTKSHTSAQTHTKESLKTGISYPTGRWRGLCDKGEAADVRDVVTTPGEPSGHISGQWIWACTSEKSRETRSSSAKTRAVAHQIWRLSIKSVRYHQKLHSHFERLTFLPLVFYPCSTFRCITFFRVV